MKNIHLLPTTQDSWLCLKDGELVNANDGGCMLGYDPPRWLTQHIYITNSEEIKKGWYFNNAIDVNNLVFIKSEYIEGLKEIFGEKPSHLEKIILTTDTELIADGVQAIEDEFLEWFVQNPSCEEVEVKKGKMKLNDDGEEYGFPDMSLYQITIPKEELKETLEEAAESYAEFNQYDLAYHDEGGYQGIDTKIFAKKLIDFTNKWFEQFKKK